MALTFTPRVLGQSGQTRESPGGLFCTVTSVTLDASYAAGGVVLPPTQLGMTGNVFFGIVNIRTNTATGPGDGTLDCTTPGAPKLKLQAASNAAELGAGAAAGAVLDVLAFGY